MGCIGGAFGASLANYGSPGRGPLADSVEREPTIRGRVSKPFRFPPFVMADTTIALSYSTDEARRLFDEVLRHAVGDKQHVVLTQDGEAIAAVIPIEALGLLDRVFEALEDEVDLREAKRIMADEHSEFVPWEEVEQKMDASNS